MSSTTLDWTDKTLADGRYHVRRRLGEGGMAVVYLADDRNLDTQVVIKVPQPALLADPQFAERFRREVRSLVKLSHPHIVKLFDVGEHEGVPFAVMQYLAGGSAEDRPRALRTLRAWLPQIGSALDFIHAKGFVHRDVKPGNILFDENGNAYLSDFGIVKAVAEGERSGQRDATLTRTGMVVGTPDYMAPEVIMGEPYDGRADQYSLAVVLYELLAGQPPFDGSTPAAVLVQHTTAIPANLDARNPSIPQDVAAAVRRALEKQPSARFPDCETLARQVATLVREAPPPMVVVEGKTSRPEVAPPAIQIDAASRPPQIRQSAARRRPRRRLAELGSALQKAVRSADDRLRRMAGEDNHLLHQFLRVVFPFSALCVLYLSTRLIPSQPVVQDQVVVAQALESDHGSDDALAKATIEVERCVDLGLQWLAAVQMPDGGWCFDHTRNPLNTWSTSAPNPGTMIEARNAATALALLAFLSTGCTHKEGAYQDTVQGGLGYLINRMAPDGSLHEPAGTMYSHAMGSMALCRAFGMSHDKALMAPAQASLNFISYAQDPNGGGWRYAPRRPGDTSVTGWQALALKDGHFSYLQVNPNTIRGLIRFLDSVQDEKGVFYGYDAPADDRVMTAIAMNTRRYLGWKAEDPRCQEAGSYFSNMGPSATDMYFNFFATEFMLSCQGKPWDDWYRSVRNALIARQNQIGAAAGSWFIEGADQGAQPGGRVYFTAMAILILQTPARVTSWVQPPATAEHFPL